MNDHTPERIRRTVRNEQTPTDVIYASVARIEGTDPRDLPPLGETLDPEALDDLLDEEATTDRIVFDYLGYEVTATADWVVVEVRE
jgi:hypothetical protein